MGIRAASLLLFTTLSLCSCEPGIEPTEVLPSPEEKQVFPANFTSTTYKVGNIRVIDGDTIEADVYLWPNLILHDRFRLDRIDAPEMRGEEMPRGELSKKYLSKLLDEGEIRLSVRKKGKYGRWLIELYRNDENLNQRMMDDGYARPYGK